MGTVIDELTTELQLLSLNQLQEFARIVQRVLMEKERAQRHTSETTTALQVRLVLEQQTSEIAKKLRPMVPAGVGLILIMSDYGSAGNTAYCATVERTDALRLLRELLERWGA